jgi:ribose transport system substrate-binding protein
MPPAYNEKEILQVISGARAKTGSIASIVAADMQNPTRWTGPTTPVSLPKSPLKLSLISCEATLTGCVAPLNAIQSIGKRFGWSTTLYDGQGNDSVINQDILAAIAAHDNAIFIAGVDPNALQQGLRAAKKAGISVISITECLNTPNPVVKPAPGYVFPNVDVAQNGVAAGRALADWVVKDSHGKASVAIASDRESASQVDDAAAVDEINKLCPDCKTSSFSMLGADLATTFPQATISFLRAHPSVRYIILPYDPAATVLVPALRQAGMKNIKLLDVLGIAQNLEFIRTGQSQVADVAWDNAYEGWAGVDQMLRILAHQPLISPNGEGIPQILLDKTNVPGGTGNWASSIKYQSHYLGLWKKG